MAEGGSDIRHKLAALRRNLITFRRLIWPAARRLSTRSRSKICPSSPPATAFAFAKPRPARRASATSFRPSANAPCSSTSKILDTRAEQMNQTMLLLAAVTVVLMPLTVISGILGMNVAGIPLRRQSPRLLGRSAGAGHHRRPDLRLDAQAEVVVARDSASRPRGSTGSP